MRVPIVVEERTGLDRTAEPVTVGVPLPRGAAAAGSGFRLVGPAGEPLLAQARVLSRWSDRSARWVLVDLLASVAARGRLEVWLEPCEAGAEETPASPLTVVESREEVRTRTGRVEATFPRMGTVLLAKLTGGAGELLDDAGLALLLEDEAGGRHELETTSVDVSAAGPVRATVTVRGRLGPTLLVEARLSLFAGRGLVRADVTLRNPRAAVHEGGLWDLGDPGSVLFRDLGLVARLGGGAEAPRALLRHGAGAPLEEAPAGPVEVYQDSSGGARWDARTHVSREDRVPLAFRGYRVATSAGEVRGDRAEPALWVVAGPGLGLGATVAEFWQCFPKALEASGAELRARLWPGQAGDLHELQGGEQKTHRVWLSAEEPEPLAWVQGPLLARSSPEAYAASGAIPMLLPRAEDEDRRVLDLVDVIVHPTEGFAARREIIDEYGWRDYGEVYADHEAVRHEGPEPLVSHYNNQYDGLYAALVQGARSGAAAWLELGDANARHIADVDIYHTELDRPAYAGGPFWHTDHYTDAHTSTHRCYSRRSPRGQAGGGYGGGPSNEHDYIAGLALHYLMTGWEPSRAAALRVAEWVIDADDGSLTRLGKVLPGPTGLSTRTVSPHYQGPGRGGGNSVHTLVDAFELSGNERYLRAAEAFIRRIIHPDDDREALGLLEDPENRWSYTVLLVAMLHYLEVKAEADELDEAYAYARETVLSSARWMMAHERLSSTMKERLLFWTESWPAQDTRKGIVLMAASRLLEPGEERRAMHAQGRELYDAAVDELLEWETKDRARPLVLMARYGVVGSWLKARGLEAETIPAGPPLRDRGRPKRFVPWKAWPGLLKETVSRRVAALRR